VTAHPGDVAGGVQASPDPGDPGDRGHAADHGDDPQRAFPPAQLLAGEQIAPGHRLGDPLGCADDGKDVEQQAEAGQQQQAEGGQVERARGPEAVARRPAVVRRRRLDEGQDGGRPGQRPQRPVHLGGPPVAGPPSGRGGPGTSKETTATDTRT
jgi:hypothetical protein